jgi:predicted site-specific integrase-resolvase
MPDDRPDPLIVASRCPTLGPIGSAEFLGVKEQTLATWRCNGRYPLPFIRVGRRIRYRISDLEAFLESRTVGA